MALGKKKRDIAVKEQMVQMQQNPLYPEKQESTAKEVLTALGTALVCFVLVGIITTNFSYSFGNVRTYEDDVVYDEEIAGANAYTDDEETDDEGIDDSEVYEEENDDMGTGTVIEEEEMPETDLTNGDFIIADSDSRYISESELEGMTKEELSYARNEIYARHGRTFKDEGLQQYFDSKEWYEGTVSPDDFSESMLNDYEIENAETILSYEKEKGYR